MGYACPVCEEPQVDARHLADHLAITASLRGGDHETWLDEHVPDWSDRDAETLGPLLAEHATEIDLDVPEVGEADAREATDARMAGVDPRHSSDARRRVAGSRDRLSDRDRAILQEARKMTAKMLGEKTDEGQEGTEGNDGVGDQSEDPGTPQPEREAGRGRATDSEKE